MSETPRPSIKIPPLQKLKIKIIYPNGTHNKNLF